MKSLPFHIVESQQQSRVQKLFLILILIFSFSILVNAQNFRLGFDLGIHQVRINNGTGILGGNGLPLSIHLNADYNLSQKFNLQSKLGRTFHVEFMGWELGLNGRYIFFHPFYASGGILLHLNEGTTLGLADGTAYATILMFSSGVGICATSVFSIEINYFIPTSHPQIGGYLDFLDYKSHTYYLKSMIRLCFNFNWDL